MFYRAIRTAKKAVQTQSDDFDREESIIPEDTLFTTLWILIVVIDWGR